MSDPHRNGTRWSNCRLRVGPTANCRPDGPTADSGRREWTQRFLDFCFLSVCAIAEIAWLIMLAWATLSLALWLFA